jgi:universal stress protein A
MLPIHTVLHPTDFSWHSEYALRVACALVRDYGAHLILLHVAALPGAVYAEGAFVPEPATYYESLKQQLEQVALPDASLGVERRIEEGDAAAKILEVARETVADMIVMGTHGRTGLSRLLMGSVAEQVVRQATCPVMIVRMPMPITLPATATPEMAPCSVGGVK